MRREDLEHDELHPPSAQRVARRALVLVSCACRSSLENSPSNPGSMGMHRELQRWAANVGVQAEFEPQEWSAICSPLGTLSVRDHMNLGWKSEALAVMAWALQLADLPSYDQPVDGADYAARLCFLAPAAEQFIAGARVRGASDLKWLADVMESIHWRLRHHQFDKSLYDFRNHQRPAPTESANQGAIRLVHGDLEIRGLSLPKVPSDILSECGSITVERHQAANWLIGTSLLYSQTPCDT